MGDIPQIIVPQKTGNSEQAVTNKNFLSPVGYRFNVLKLPYTNFFVQRINIPGVSVGTVDQPTPFKVVPIPGDHVNFDELVLTFRVDENMNNYQEIFNWILGEGVFSFEDYTAIASQAKTSGHGLRSDFSLIIETSKKNPNYNIVFSDGFPVALSELQFNIMDQAIDYIEATVTFKYAYYQIQQVV